LTHTTHAVALGVEGFRLLVDTVGMKKTALFDGQQKDQAVDQAQELVEVVLDGQRPALQICQQSAIGGVSQEALAECHQRLLDPLAQIRPCSGALFAPSLTPSFERTISDGLA